MVSVLVAPNARRIRNSSPNPRRHITPCTHTCQVQLCVTPNQPLTSGQRPLLFAVRKDLIRVIGGNCTLPTIRIWKPTLLANPHQRQRLIQTNPRSDAPVTPPNSAAPLAAPHFALAAGVDSPQPAALRSQGVLRGQRRKRFTRTRWNSFCAVNLEVHCSRCIRPFSVSAHGGGFSQTPDPQENRCQPLFPWEESRAETLKALSSSN